MRCILDALYFGCVNIMSTELSGQHLLALHKLLENDSEDELMARYNSIAKFIRKNPHINDNIIRELERIHSEAWPGRPIPDMRVVLAQGGDSRMQHMQPYRRPRRPSRPIYATQYAPSYRAPYNPGYFKKKLNSAMGGKYGWIYYIAWCIMWYYIGRTLGKIILKTHGWVKKAHLSRKQHIALRLPGPDPDILRNNDRMGIASGWLANTPKLPTPIIDIIMGYMETGEFGCSPARHFIDQALPNAYPRASGFSAEILSLGCSDYAMGISSDIIALRCTDYSIHLWDHTKVPADKKDPLISHTGDISAMRVLRDGRLVSASADNTICVWDTEISELLHRFNVNTTMMALVELPNGLLVSAASEQELYVWNTDTYKRVNFVQPQRAVKSSGIISNIHLVVLGGRLAACSSHSICVWDTYDWGLISNGWSDLPIICSEALKSGHLVSLMENARDGTLNVWDTNDMSIMISIPRIRIADKLTIMPDDKLVITSHGVLKVFDLSNGGALVSSREYYWFIPMGVTRIVALPNGNIVTGSGNGFVCEWDPTKLIMVHRHQRPNVAVIDMFVLPIKAGVSYFELAVLYADKQVFVFR
jgi:WD40 repeat protein